MRYFDLFAGIGGFKLAMDEVANQTASVSHVGFCELDEKARRIYRAAHLQTSAEIISVENALDIATDRQPLGCDIGSFDLLLAGFPCQSFSNVGYRKGLADDNGKLFHNILDILVTYKPAHFVLENVQKISTIDKGALLQEMTTALEQCGYCVNTWDLLAYDFGLPQNRRRMFFVGRRFEKRKSRIPPPPSKVSLSSAKYPTSWHLLEKGETDPRHLIPDRTRKTVLYKNPRWQGDVNIDNAIARPITASMAKWHRANQDNYFSQAYIEAGKPYERPAVDLATHPIRRITPLEGFRLQGFPDLFADICLEESVSYSSTYKLIGNAVPVNLASAVISQLLSGV